VARFLPFGALFVCLAFSQSLLLQIKTIEGEGAVRAPASRSGNSLVVEITDEIGRPVPDATVSFQLPDDGPSGVFATGLRTEIAMTDAQGRAAVRNFRANALPGPFEIRVTAAKDGVRAGMLSRQYIAGTEGVARGEGKRSRKKWMILAGIAAGAAVAGVAAGSGSGAAHAPAPPPASPPTLTIGAPVEIAIGAP
jgi:hypothetical protein